MKRYFGFPFIAFVAACSGSNDASRSDAPTALVSLAKVQSGSAHDELTLFGIAEAGPDGRRSLVAPAEATVVAIVAPAGSAVSAGQTIVSLSPSPGTRADAAKAQGDAVAANKALARAIRLRGDGLASDADVETARASATAASALKASFERKLGSLLVRAPSAGTIDGVTAVVGDLVPAGGAIATVSSSDDIRARFGVDPETVYRLRTGMAGKIQPKGLAAIAVRVQSINPTVDPQTRLASVFVSLPRGSRIAAGQALTLLVELPTESGALSVPYSALMDDAGQPFVYVVNRGVAHRRDVEIRASTSARVTVIKGLKVGELVVVNGGTGLDDGIKVRTQ